VSAVGAFWDKLGPEILQGTLQHLQLTFFALTVAVSIALPVGILLTRLPWKGAVSLVMGAASVVQTVPSLALMAFIVLLFSLVSLPTIGTVPALVALVLYALLPILRNTFTGIRQVDPSVIEVAKGMGMRWYQVLFSVELPLSLPVIMAGIRISTVWTIGVATLCGLIGAGGLGDLIIKGLRSFHMDYVMAGTVPAAAMAILFDFILGRIENWLTPEGIGKEEANNVEV